MKRYRVRFLDGSWTEIVAHIFVEAASKVGDAIRSIELIDSNGSGKEGV